MRTRVPCTPVTLELKVSLRQQGEYSCKRPVYTGPKILHVVHSTSATSFSSICQVSRNLCYCCFCIPASRCKTAFLGPLSLKTRSESGARGRRRCCLVSVAQYSYCRGWQASTLLDDVGLSCTQQSSLIRLHQDRSERRIKQACCSW